MNKITGVVDYGAGNLYSVLRGLRGAEISAEIVSTPSEVLNCDYLIVPGVGAFGDGVKQLHERGLYDAIKKFSETEKPVLGICLGTQLFLSFSNEFGRHAGLDMIEGEVNPIISEDDLAIPHVGWAALKENNRYDKTILWNVKDDDHFYFTHSFHCCVADQKNILAKFVYGSQELTAVIRKENIMGCQFHPELSSYPGIQLLRNFRQL